MRNKCLYKYNKYTLFLKFEIYVGVINIRAVAWGFRLGGKIFANFSAIFPRNFTKFGKFWGGGRLPPAGYGPEYIIRLYWPSIWRWSVTIQAAQKSMT